MYTYIYVYIDIYIERERERMIFIRFNMFTYTIVAAESLRNTVETLLTAIHNLKHIENTKLYFRFEHFGGNSIFQKVDVQKSW